MAASNPPGFMQARTDHSALVVRRALMSMLDGASAGATLVYGGVNPTYGNRLLVTGSGSLLQSTIADGLCVVPSAAAYGGAYFCYNDANVTLTHAAAHATQYRRDYVVAQVLDTTAGDGSDQWQLAIVQGANNASSPAPLPTLPARSIPLAVARIDPTITNLTGKIDDFRTFYSNIGVLSCYAGTRPATPHQGLLTADFDGNKQLSYYDGTAYRFVADAGWQNYTPSISGGGSLVTSTRAGRYKYLGDKTIAVQVWFVVSTAGSGSGTVTVSLPATPARTVRQTLTATTEETSGSNPKAAVAIILTSGSGANIDRIRFQTSGDHLGNINGSDLLAGMVVEFGGVFETT